jgi:hypothetical protein
MQTKNIIGQLLDEGESLEKIQNRKLIIAFLSLKLSLNSWFSTYHSIKNKFLFITEYCSSESEKDFPKKISSYPDKYFELYSETIIHLHHFFELILKDILSNKKYLLILNIPKDSDDWCDVILGNEIDNNRLEKINTIEFQETLNRVIILLDQGTLDSHHFSFIKENKESFEAINKLRNRLLHKGTFILPYHTLDQIMIDYFIPIVDAIINLPRYIIFKESFIYSSLFCKIDPFNEFITSDGKMGKDKIAYLKELGRAAYNNPIQIKNGKTISLDIRERYEKSANILKQYDLHLDVLICPVCGCKSLIRYCDEVTLDSSCSARYFHTTEAVCACCTFQVFPHLQNASRVGLPLEDYWIEEFTN